MAHRSSTKYNRLTVAIPSELKNRLNKMATGQGKKVSALIRESIEETLARMERDLFVEKMREAYLGMAEENLNTAEEFKYADAENL